MPYAAGKQILVIASAGNDDSAAPHYPSDYPGVLSVASVGADGQRAPNSNVGPGIDMAAPGRALLTTVPGGGHGTLDGTSGAAAVTSGGAALALGRWGDYGQRLANRLTSGAEDAQIEPSADGSAEKRTEFYGDGRARFQQAAAEPVVRLFGVTRFQTAARISQEAVPRPVDRVVLVPGSNPYDSAWGDTLPAAGLTGTLDTAYVVTGMGDTLHPDAETELNRLFRLAPDERGDGKVLVIAGNTDTSVSQAVEQSLSDRGFAVRRVAADLLTGERSEEERVRELRQGNPAGAVRLAQEILSLQQQESGVAPRTVLVARRDTYIDALALASVAAANRWPLLYVDTGAVPPETCDFLAQTTVDVVHVAGGNLAVSDEVETQLRTGCGAPPNEPREGQRLFGVDRVETSRRVAEFFYSGQDGYPSPGGYILASGNSAPDALAGAPLARAFDAPTLVTLQRDGLEPVLREYVCAAPLPEGRSYVLGGEVAVSTPAEQAFSSAVRGDGCDGGQPQPGPEPTPSVLWGVDSSSQHIDEIYTDVVEQYGEPLVWGRYLGTPGTRPKHIDREEVEFAHARGIRLGLFFFDYENGETVGDAGRLAQLAIDEAVRLGVPEGVSIFVDIEPPSNEPDRRGGDVDAEFIRTWFERLKADGRYRPGYYGSSRPGSQFHDEFCAAGRVNPAVAAESVIWSFVPSLERTTRDMAPDYMPESLDCGADGPTVGQPAAWQYALDGGDTRTPVIDTDLVNSDSGLWGPPGSQPPTPPPPPPSSGTWRDGDIVLGDTGPDVLEARIRVAGYADSSEVSVRTMPLTDAFDEPMQVAVRGFQEFFALPVTGVIDEQTKFELDRQVEPDGSTVHFDFHEFADNRCAEGLSDDQAEAQCFSGGGTDGNFDQAAARENVRRVMHRLEPLRRRYDAPFQVTSGFRNLDHNNDVEGSADDSQHLYGTGVDFVLPDPGGRRKVGDNRMIRDWAMGAGWHAIFCYNPQAHNHLDIRSNNDDDDTPGQEPPIDPDTDDQGRHLTSGGSVCAGDQGPSGGQG